jgi:cytochrome c oxidase cbb3-type subunit 1
MLLMAYNTFRTVASGKAVDAKIPAVNASAHA